MSGELTCFTESEGLQCRQYEYTYDSSGNRTRFEKTGVDQPETITYEYNSANQLVASTSTITGRTEYTYDANGNLIEEQTQGAEAVTYEYTVEQRLSAIRQGGVLLMAASYDGDGNRIFQIYRKEVRQGITENDPTDGEDVPENPSDSEESFCAFLTRVLGLGDTNGYDYGLVHTFYAKDYVDPAESIFWYGFGQGLVQFVGLFNPALAAYLSDWLSHAWDAVTGQYGLTLYSEVAGYSTEDLEAMREAGLTDTDIAQIVGMPQASEHTQPSEESSDTVVLPGSPQSEDEIRVDYELTYYINDINTENAEVLMEYGKSGAVKSVYTYGVERISVETPTSTDEGADYYLYDGRGSVSQVLGSEDIVACYTYDPFGNVTSGAPTFDSFYGYNGEDTNPITGLQYLRARYYDTETGRFSVKDNILGDIFAPLTLNRYAYVMNNPIMYTDDSGHWGALIGAVVGAVVGAVTGAASEVISAAVEGRKVNWKQAGVNAVSGAAGGAAAGAIVATTGNVKLASTVGGAVGGAVGGYVGTRANGGSRSAAAKNAFKGAIAGAVGGYVGGSVGSKFSSSLAGTVAGSVAGGSAGQFTGSLLNGASLKDALASALDPKQALVNALSGLTGYATYQVMGVPLGDYLELKTNEIKAKVVKFNCGDAEKIQAQDVVESVKPKVSTGEDAGESSHTKYLEQLEGFSDNKINHIINGSKGSNHGWENLVADKNWNSIKNIIAEVMETGVEGPYKTVYSKKSTINGYEVEVTYTKLGDGTIKISDAWINQ